MATLGLLLSPAGGQDFVDTTELAGITASHHGTYLVTGQAWGDYDQDGWPDLYLTDSSGPNSLYHNNGDGTFTLSTLSAGVALTGAESGGTSFADFDNDGWPDLYVANRGDNTLFHNIGGVEFVDVTAAAGVAALGEGESVTWGDYDKDGFLDLYVVNWYFFDDESSPLSQDHLLHNNGDGTFTDVTDLLDLPRTRGPGFAATFFDYDNDGDQDLYVVNDKLWGNLLWRNDGPGCAAWCFTDVSVATGAHRPVWGMGVASGDYDNDGDLDLYFSSIGEQVLLQNQTSQGNPIFTDVSAFAGVGFDAIGWGSIFFDYDNDGWLDLYLATMTPGPDSGNRLFRNRGDGTFEDRSATSGCSNTGPTIGVANVDYDLDGRSELIIGNYNQGYALYRNESELAAANNWLSLRLEGRDPINRDALGTRVYLVTSGGRALMQELTCDSSLGAGNHLVLHFGLGDQLVESATIVWADGYSETLTTVPVNEIFTRIYPAVFTDGFESGDLSQWLQ